MAPRLGSAGHVTTDQTSGNPALQECQAGPDTAFGNGERGQYGQRRWGCGIGFCFIPASRWIAASRAQGWFVRFWSGEGEARTTVLERF